MTPLMPIVPPMIPPLTTPLGHQSHLATVGIRKHDVGGIVAAGATSIVGGVRLRQRLVRPALKRHRRSVRRSCGGRWFVALSGYPRQQQRLCQIPVGERVMTESIEGKKGVERTMISPLLSSNGSDSWPSLLSRSLLMKVPL